MRATRGGCAVFLQNRDFFGAMVVHVPLMHALRQADAAAPLVVYSPFERGRMFAALGLADEVRVYSRAGHALWRELRERSYDRIVSLRPQSLGLTAVIGASGARRTLGFATALSRVAFSRTLPRNVSIYRARNYLNLLEGEIAVPAIAEPVRWLAARGRAAVEPGSPTYCLMPCGQDEFKLWGEAGFVSVARALVDEDANARLLLVLGTGEARYTRVFAEAGLGPRTSALVDANLFDIARAVLDCRAVVSNDCGPSHVAQLSEVPHVSIFGNWDGRAAVRIDEWFHRRDGAVCLTTSRAAPIASIAVDAVLDALHSLRDEPGATARVVAVEPQTALSVGNGP